MYEVALPSYNRPEGLRDKTLALLTHYKINPKHITVFVANDDEKKRYADILPKDAYNKIVVGIKGLHQVRNFIADYYPLGAEIVELDDDVKDLLQLDEAGKKLIPVKDFDALIKEGFKLCKEHKLHLWGIAPVKNAFFMKKEVSFNLKFIIGHLWGMINRRIPSTFDFKEDYERTLENAVRDGGVVRFNNIVATTKLGAPGGIGVSAKERAKSEEHKKKIDELKQRFPGLIRDNKNRTNEILLSRSLNAYNKAKSRGGKSAVRPTPSNPLVGGMPKRTEAEKPPKNEISEADRNDDTITVLRIRNKDKYNKAKQKLLEALKHITVPKIAKPSTTTSTNRGNVIGTIGRTITMGFGDTRRGYNYFASNNKNPKFRAVFDALVEFGNTVVPKDWEYQTITLNHNAKAKKHTDSKNVGKSVIIGIGDYKGGDIRVFKSDDSSKDYDLHDTPVMFNGGLLPHETQPFELPKDGVGRYTMIFFKQARKPKGSPVGVGSGLSKGLPQPKEVLGIFA